MSNCFWIGFGSVFGVYKKWDGCGVLEGEGWEGWVDGVCWRGMVDGDLRDLNRELNWDTPSHNTIEEIKLTKTAIQFAC